MLNALNEAINNMVDYQHAELIVDRIEYDGDDIYNVMQETDNIHLDNVSSLTDESGQVYNLYLCNTRRGSSSERRIYAIQFEDNPALPIGTVLTVGPQYWRKEIPKSKPVQAHTLSLRQCPKHTHSKRALCPGIQKTLSGRKAAHSHLRDKNFNLQKIQSRQYQRGKHKMLPGRGGALSSG